MEPKSQMISTIKEITSLLAFSEEEYWLSYFNHILEEVNKEQNEEYLSSSILKAFQGGIGSLNDLVLHKEGRPLIEENNKFDYLKDKLFDICMTIKER